MGKIESICKKILYRNIGVPLIVLIIGWVLYSLYIGLIKIINIIGTDNINNMIGYIIISNLLYFSVEMINDSIKAIRESKKKEDGK